MYILSHILLAKVTDSLRHSLTGHLTLSAISPFFLVRFERYLHFFPVEYDEKAVSDRFEAHSLVFKGGKGGIFSDFRELSFCVPLGPYFVRITDNVE